MQQPVSRMGFVTVPPDGNGAVELQLSRGAKQKAELQGKAWVWDWVLVVLWKAQDFTASPFPKGIRSLCFGRADCPLPFSSTKVFSIVFIPFEAQSSIPGSSLGCCALISPPWSHLVRDVGRASCIQPLVIPNIPSWLILQMLLMWEAAPCSPPTRTIPWLIYCEQQGAFPGCPLSLGREGDLGSCWNYRALQRAGQSCLL